ncbi:Signaling protein RIC-8/synembryn (regulates neurotransmitter secretion) [Phaffia rhodozyma]|uniref:Signaling protein RIC-8/synembryn (Regulates neurotransmitter secretion) n=1 Tax=Phaffia rhodozyma TaxID=264483 RepID=A0A0F7SMN6_PHARH|nr:Signaling protein RIC-8/synembryn (regulates neurotransmitter secretion) [Phaffia rhodozyma]
MDTFKADLFTSLPPYGSSSLSSYDRVLRTIINTPPTVIQPTQRKIFLNEILRRLEDRTFDSNSTLLALQAVKTLGRNPTGSELLADKSVLGTVLSYTALPLNTFTSVSQPTDQTQEKAPMSSPSDGFGNPTSTEALRILANGLLLHESARDALSSLGGGHVGPSLVTVLGWGSEDTRSLPTNSKKLSSLPTPDTIFIITRILFLLTVKQSSLITTLVTELELPHILAHRIRITPPASSSPLDPLPELLKLTFNILMHYPRSSVSAISMDDDGGFISEVVDESAQIRAGAIGHLWDTALDCLAEPLINLLLSLPLPSQASPIPPPSSVSQTLNCLLTLPTTPLSSTWLLSSSELGVRGDNRPGSSSVAGTNQVDTARALLGLAERMTAPWNDTTERTWPSVQIVEATLSVLFLLMARLCAGLEVVRLHTEQYLFPLDLDRAENSTLLQERSTLLGRLLRLMTSPKYSQTKIAIGEIFFAVSNKNPDTMSALIGYGNAAGFLLSKGFTANAPVSSSKSNSLDNAPRSNSRLNPVTGLAPTGGPTFDTSMTEEEKEREAERLFVLFERIKKNPAVSMGVPNGEDKEEGEKGRRKTVDPVRQAVESGRWQEMDESTEEAIRRLDLEDQRDEQEAEKELATLKARRNF